MSFSETNNDIWDTGLNNDIFSLLSKLDENCHVIVKTPCGDTNKFTLHNIIMQGSVFGSLKCAVQIDTLGRDSLSDEEGTCLYKYKQGITDVMSLSMVDDIIGISTCSVDSIDLNATINSKIESRKLRFSEDKCAKLHINKRQKNRKCYNNLKVHNSPMKNKDTIKYLGDFLNCFGTIDDTINDRKCRATGIITQISSLLSSISLGWYYFEIALVLRESMLINSILISCESWYVINKNI